MWKAPPGEIAKQKQKQKQKQKTKPKVHEFPGVSVGEGPKFIGFPWWRRGLRIQCGLCSGLGRC